MTRKGISGSALKFIALVSMFIDHFAAVFYAESWRALTPFFSQEVYMLLRKVGRPAFPIYCFLLVEGYQHTRSVPKYLLRLFLFGVVSELPFDLAFRFSYMDWSYQNVFFTLFLGLLAIWLWDLCTKKDFRSCGPWRILLGVLCVAGCALLGHFGQTDYGEHGVLFITALYLLRQWELPRDLVSAGVLYLASPLEIYGFFDYLLFHFYDGRRGRQPKYLFYGFYPAHLLLLVLVSRWLFGTSLVL